LLEPAKLAPLVFLRGDLDLLEVRRLLLLRLDADRTITSSDSSSENADSKTCS